MTTKIVATLRNGKTRKEVKDLINSYLLAAVDGENYNKELTTDKEKVNFVMDTFKSEYLHRNNRQGNICTLFAEWLQGLPSSFNVDFENYRILEITELWGLIIKTDSEAKKDKILGNWFNYIANKFFQLHEKLNKQQKIQYKTFTQSFCLGEDRSPRKGKITIKPYDEIKIGDYVGGGREDVNNGLEVFWKIDAEGAWGVHPCSKRSEGSLSIFPGNVVRMVRV